MKTRNVTLRLFSLFILCIYNASYSNNDINRYIFTKNSTHSNSDWTIIGAGPGGIITIGLLLDLGISGSSITWIDPEFTVGRLGKYYATVPANTKTKLFVSFMQSCKTFMECKSEAINKLQEYEQEKELELAIIVKPLQDITEHLKTKVNILQGNVTGLEFEDTSWNVTVDNSKQITSENVVLATGSHPRSLHYPCEQEISLDIALNKDLLKDHISQEDSIAVIGSSHSAVLVLKFLTELKVKRIINFYKNPIQYAIDMGTWLLHNSTGLKGVAAQWAREVLEKNPPAHLIRMINTPDALQAWLPVCNKIIYAVGYERNELPLINGQNQVTYNDHSGVIAPRLFGIGIAFPEEYIDPLGNKEHRVGLNSFMEYAQRVIPQWINKETRSRLRQYEELFVIDLL